MSPSSAHTEQRGADERLVGRPLVERAGEPRADHRHELAVDPPQPRPGRGERRQLGHLIGGQCVQGACRSPGDSVAVVRMNGQGIRALTLAHRSLIRLLVSASRPPSFDRRSTTDVEGPGQLSVGFPLDVSGSSHSFVSARIGGAGSR